MTADGPNHPNDRHREHPIRPMCREWSSDMLSGMNAPEKARRLRRLVVAIPVVGLMSLAACGDDDESAQDRYCEAGEQLRADMAALVDVDIIASGTDGVQAAFSDVESSVDELRSSASDAAEDEVAAFVDALDDVGDALGALGGEISRDNASGVIEAIQAASAAAQDVYGTLSDCP